MIGVHEKLNLTKMLNHSANLLNLVEIDSGKFSLTVTSDFNVLANLRHQIDQFEPEEFEMNS